jgi:hypothetical protein
MRSFLAIVLFIIPLLILADPRPALPRILAFELAWPAPAPASSALNVRDFGAKGDGVTLDHPAIQRAIDAAHARGGAIVQLPAGTYLSGTIELRSGVTLDLAADSVLLGSGRLADYRRGNWPALILAKDQTRIAITGLGAIDGNSPVLVPTFDEIKKSGDGLAFVPGIAPGQILEFIGPTGVLSKLDAHALQSKGKLIEHLYGPHTRPYEYVRPQIIEFWNCREIILRDITLRNAANWVQVYRDCEDLLFERIKVRSTQYWNNDGIDLVDCKRVRLLDSDIDSADDALCLKSDPLGTGCEDILVRNCKLASRASAVKFGTASHHAFRRIHISDITVRDTYRSVIALQTVDGAVIEDVLFERAKATETGNAFFLRIGHRTQKKDPGILRRVIIRDMDVQVPPLPKNYQRETNENHNLLPSSIVGLPGYPVTDILLENITVRYGGNADRTHAEVPLDRVDSVPERARDYPEFSQWGELPAWGAFIRNTQGVTLRNVHFTLENPDFRPAVVATLSPDLALENLRVGPGGGEPLVFLKDSPGATATLADLPAGTKEPLRVRSAPRPDSAK